MFKKLPQKLFPSVKYHGLFLSVNILLNAFILLLSPLYLINYKHQLTVNAQKISINKQPKVATADYGSNKECSPLEPNDCEFYEVCVLENITSPGHCKFDDNWRNTLTDDEKLQLREAFGTYGLDMSLFSTDPKERLALGNYLSIHPPRPAPPDNWHIYQDTIRKAIYGTYPQLSSQEKDKIVNVFESAWMKRQEEVLEVELNGLMIAWNIAAIPETLGTGFAIKDGIWQLIKNPTARSKIVVQLKKIPEAISALKNLKNPASLGTLIEIDNVPVLACSTCVKTTQRVVVPQMDTLTGIRVYSKEFKVGANTGNAVDVMYLTARINDVVAKAKSIVRNMGGFVDNIQTIQVAATKEDFYKLLSLQLQNNEGVIAFYDGVGKIVVINPEYIHYPSEYLINEIAHELIHHASLNAGFYSKVSRWFGKYADSRVVEAFTEYLTVKYTPKPYGVSSHSDRVFALRNMFYQYAEDWLKVNNYPQTEENIRHIYNQLLPVIKSYVLTNSYELEAWYDQLYGPGKFGEWLKYFFNGVSSVPVENKIAFKPLFNYSFFSLNTLIEKLLPQKTYAVMADLSACCRDWPDEGELKTPFLNALQTSEDLKIYEWSPENFEALIQLEFLRDRLNTNKELTTKDFQDLQDEDITVEADEIKLPEAIDIETLPVATADIFAPLPQTEPDLNIVPPANNNINTLPSLAPSETPPDGQTENQISEKTIVGNCNVVNDKNPWICEWPDHSWQNCLDAETGNQSLFNDTYCPGSDNKGPELMWKYQAALAHGGNGTECGGEIQSQLPNCEPNSQ